MIKKLISIVIPVYNVEKYLEEAVESVLAIQNLNIEVILVDDGSADKSGMICDRMAECDKRVRVYHKRNEGVSSARNLGIELANGEYLCFLDSDDILDAKAFETIGTDLIEKHWDMAISGFFTVTEEQKIVGKNQNAACENLHGDTASIMLMHWNLKVRMGSFLVHHKVTEQIRFTTAFKYGEDVEYIHKCLLNSKQIKVFDNCCVLYRVNEDSAISHINLRRYDNYFARKRYQKYVQTNFPEYQELLREIEIFNIPECLADNVSLMCRSRIPYRELVNYLRTSGIETEMKRYTGNPEAEPRFRGILEKWCDNAFIFYWSTRLEADYYCLREKAGRLKMRLMNNG